jgi:ERCC4-related helicase
MLFANPELLKEELERTEASITALLKRARESNAIDEVDLRRLKSKNDATIKPISPSLAIVFGYEMMPSVASNTTSTLPPQQQLELEPELEPQQQQHTSDDEPLLSYQKWLHDEAVHDDGNGIVVLPTGTGKTRVAFEIIMSALRRHPDRAVVFLCPNVNLVVQQANYFERKFLPTVVDKPLRRVHVARAAGGSGKEELAKLSAVTGAATTASFVLFATGGTFRNFLEENESAGLVRALDRMSLLVLDECHHANRMEGANANGDTKHDYTRIMEEFYQDDAVDVTHRPKIIGLTASPGETKTDIGDLAETLMAKILFPTSPPALVAELKQKTQSTTTDPRLVNGTDGTSASGTTLLETLRTIKELDRKEVSPKIQSAADVEAIREQKDCNLAGELFRCIGWGGWLDVLRASTNIGAEYGPLFEQLNRDATRTNGAGSGESPLLQAVKRALVEAVNRPGNKLRAIVFVTSIDAAKLMQQVLNTLDDRRIQAGILTGQQELTKAQQTDAVRRFHAGEFNVLVANSVAEEGLDIQACNLVIRTEPPTSIIRNIQGRGRARQADALYVVMCLDGSETEAVNELRGREDAAVRALKTFILGQSDESMALPSTITSWSRFTPQGAGAGADEDEHVDGGPAHAAGGFGGGAILPGYYDDDEDSGAEYYMGSHPPTYDGRRGRGGKQSKPPFDFDADYKSQLNLHIQKTLRPGNSAEYAAIRYTDHPPTGPPHLRVFTASVSYGGKGPYRGDPCDTKKKSHQSAAWRALQADGLHI